MAKKELAKNTNIVVDLPSFGVIEASPLPIQHSCVAMFTDPTGARTDIRMACFFVILTGAVQYVVGSFI